MTIKNMVRIASDMRKRNSFLLDISSLDEKESAFITVLVKNIAIFEFFEKVQDMSVKKLYVVCKYLEYLEELEKLEQVVKEHEQNKMV